jgi:hypothetical protein
MRRRWCIGACVLLGLAAVSLARQGVVTTISDQRYIGDIDASAPDTVVVMSHGVQITIDRPDVQSIEYLDQLDQEYHDRMAKLGPADIPGRLVIARWAMDLGRLDLALSAVDQAVLIGPTDKDALALRTSIVQEIANQHPTSRPAEPQTPAVMPPLVLSGNATTLPAPATNPILHPVLTASDIQEIRRNELRLTDTSVRFRFDNDVRKRYAAAQAIDANAFLSRPPIEQAVMIIASGDKLLSDDVQVMNDPSAIQLFKQRVQPLVVTGCASVGCHGGPGGGSLYLAGTPDSEALTYTNFYALESYFRQVPITGPFGAGPARRQMIDRTNTGDSLLLQYGLPSTVAQIPHPPLANYNGFFRGPDDPRYLTIQAWISEALVPLEPAYDIPRPVLHRANSEPSTKTTVPAIATTEIALPPATSPAIALPPATLPASKPATSTSTTGPAM